jgi:hypothetical protein
MAKLSETRQMFRATFREDMPMRLKVGKDIDLRKQFGHEGHVIGSPDRSRPLNFLQPRCLIPMPAGRRALMKLPRELWAEVGDGIKG